MSRWVGYEQMAMKADGVQAQLNPFHGLISSSVFDGRIRASAKKHL